MRREPADDPALPPIDRLLHAAARALRTARAERTEADVS